MFSSMTVWIQHNLSMFFQLFVIMFSVGLNMADETCHSCITDSGKTLSVCEPLPECPEGWIEIVAGKCVTMFSGEFG